MPADQASPASSPSRTARWRGWLFVLPLLLLWAVLIDHLRIEWSLNPQYNYGWAVPFLCVYLLWNRLKVSGSKFQVPGSSGRHLSLSAFQHLSISGLGSRLLLFPLAFLYLPIRLVQQANPDWRLVSWALALMVVGLTLLVLRWSQNFTLQHSAAPLFRAPVSAFRFPLWFFLVAVPWPTIVEAPVIQRLTSLNATGAVEVLTLLGIPALRHGSVIEIGTGLVGIEEACSGIRSFQACLMIGLFLGAYFGLRVRRRLELVLAGFGLAILFNLLRTVVLVAVASTKGIPAIAQWHDPAGIAILVGCFLGVWALATWFHRHQRSAGFQPAGSGSIPAPVEAPQHRSTAPSPSALAARSPISASQPVSVSACQSALRAQPSIINHQPSFLLPVALLVWLGACEVAVEFWYSRHEAPLNSQTNWTVKLPAEAPGYRALAFEERTAGMLRFNEGLNATWMQPGGVRCQAIFLRWDPGRIAVHLARSHTPEVCLSAAGHKLSSQPQSCVVSIEGLNLTFDVYRAEAEGLWVFYCLSEDGQVAEGNATRLLTYANRLRPVLEGRRNRGQRSLEVAVWSQAEAADVRASVEQLIRSLVTTESGKR